MRARWLMSAPVAGPRTRRTASASPVLFRSCRSTAGDTGGLVSIAAPPQNSFFDLQLLTRREELIEKARRLRNQSRCKETSACLTELRAVTNACLAMGVA
jgi:hypothetical protein